MLEFATLIFQLAKIATTYWLAIKELEGWAKLNCTEI